MRNITLISTLITAGLIALSGCSKEAQYGQISSKDIVPVVKDGSQTKSGIEGVDQLKSGFKMDIIVDEDYTGGKAGKYGETRTITNEDGKGWVFDTETKWVNDVNMRFWSYNNNVAEKCDITTPGAKENSIVFTYPAKGVKADGQSDLLLAYSSKKYNESAKDTKLTIAFRHAISSISFKNELTSVDGGVPDGYTVKSISLSRFADSGKCTFDGEEGTITWSELSGASEFVVKTDAVPATSKSFLVIPQDPSLYEASIQVVLTKDGEPDIILVKKMPSFSMEAGKNYGFKLNVTPGRELEMEISVSPWFSQERDLEIKEKNITMFLNKDTYAGGIINIAESTIFIDKGMPVTGQFQLSSPKGAKLLLSLDGNIDAFKVVPKITYITDEPVQFSIIPVVNDPKIDYHTQLHVYLVQPDASVSDLDQHIMIENGAFKPYTIILPKL